MNLIEEFKKGQSGGNKGLPMGEGLANVSKAVNGVQKGRMYGFAGASKSGKSTVVDYAMVLEPFSCSSAILNFSIQSIIVVVLLAPIPFCMK